MDREDRENLEPKTCPECGSELAVETRSYQSVPVTIAVCTGYPDCTYFYWSVANDDANPGPGSVPEGLESWAINESLKILHDGMSSQEWERALTDFTRPLEEEGGGGGA